MVLGINGEFLKGERALDPDSNSATVSGPISSEWPREAWNGDLGRSALFLCQFGSSWPLPAAAGALLDVDVMALSYPGLFGLVGVAPVAGTPTAGSSQALAKTRGPTRTPGIFHQQ